MSEKEEIKSQDPNSAEAYNERGRSKYEQKHYLGALKDFGRDKRL